MKTLARRLWLEPALFLAAVNGAVQFIVNAAIVEPGSTLSWVILAVGVLLQGLGTRAVVTPVAAPTTPDEDEQLPGDGDQVVAGVPVTDPATIPPDAGDKGSA